MHAPSLTIELPVEGSPSRLNLCLALGLSLLLAAAGHAQTGPAAQSVKDLKELSIEQLMDLEVTSVSKRPEKLLDAPSAIQVITNDAIRRSGASSLPEALRLAGNLQVAQKGSHAWGISARGFNTDLANKLLVLVDGRAVYTPLYSGVFWDVQDYLLEDIDRIEVISGPGGSLWGANAVNGVINFTTKSARDTQGLYVEAGGGSHLRGFTGVRYGGSLKPNVHFRVYGKYFDRAGGVYGDGSESPDSWRIAQGGFRLDAEGTTGEAFTLQGDAYSGTENSADGATKVGGGNILGRWSRVFSEDSDMSLQVYYDRTHLASPKPAALAVGAGLLVDDLDTYDLDFQYHFRVGERHHVVWGLGYRFTQDRVQNSPSVGFLPEHLDHHLFSGFVQDEVTLRPDLHLTLGTKLEHNDYTQFEYEPSARLQLNLTPKQMLWAAISRAVRTPSRIDRDLIQRTGLPPPLPEALFGGGPDFISETVIAYESGYRTQVGSQATVAVALFYNDYDHIRSFTSTPPFGFPLITHNNVEGETYGVELTATYQVSGWWRLQGSYNLLKEHLRVKPGQVDFSNALNETADPEQQFTLRSAMDLPRGFELDASLRWVDTLRNNNGPTPGTVPAYSELDVRIGWRPDPRVELSLVGQNLLHDRHPEYGFPGAGRQEVERSVYGKATWRF
jgi:iron complex outermembrane receptor protein